MHIATAYESRSPLLSCSFLVAPATSGVEEAGVNALTVICRGGRWKPDKKRCCSEQGIIFTHSGWPCSGHLRASSNSPK